MNLLVKHSQHGRANQHFLIDIKFSEEQAQACSAILWDCLKSVAKDVKAPMKFNSSCKVSHEQTPDNKILIKFKFNHLDFHFNGIVHLKAFGKQINERVAKALGRTNHNTVLSKLGSNVAPEFNKYISNTCNTKTLWNEIISLFNNVFSLETIATAHSNPSTQKLLFGGQNE